MNIHTKAFKFIDRLQGVYDLEKLTPGQKEEFIKLGKEYIDNFGYTGLEFSSDYTKIRRVINNYKI